MDFWGISSISCNGFKIERIASWDEYKRIRDKIGKEQTHYQTGWLTIDIPPEKGSIGEAKAFSVDLINKLHLLLPFSHGHDVPVNEFVFYRITDSHETLVGHEIDSIWTGKPGNSSRNVYSHGLNNFLNSAMPLISDPEFVKKTNVALAILYYNLARDSNFLESEFIALWLGLEAMANVFYECAPTDLVLTKEEWNGLKDMCKDYLEGIGKESVFAGLLQDISFLRRGTMKEKIAYMLQDSKYQMQQYAAEIASMYDNVRVPFFHGRSIDWASNYDTVFRLRRLMEKIILKTLDFFNDDVNFAIRDVDLSKI
jgi:hypothetical protein